MSDPNDHFTIDLDGMERRMQPDRCLRGECLPDGEGKAGSVAFSLFQQTYFPLAGGYFEGALAKELATVETS